MADAFVRFDNIWKGLVTTNPIVAVLLMIVVAILLGLIGTDIILRLNYSRKLRAYRKEVTPKTPVRTVITKKAVKKKKVIKKKVLKKKVIKRKRINKLT